MIFETLIFLLGITTYPSHCVQLPEIYSYYNLHKLQDDITECKVALENFAQSSSNYIFCTIRHSHPIQVCEQCVESYMAVLTAHDQILKLEVNGTKCKDKLINLDRLNVIESIFSNVKDLWTRGFCDKCFDWSEGNPTTSNQTKTFIEYFKIAQKCINDHLKETEMLQSNDTAKICKDCMDKYLLLNSYYESLKEASESTGICMDIVDSMNATRAIWSGVLDCCKLRRTPEIIFLCCTGLITFLPVMFYLIAKIYCKKRIRIEVIGQHHFESFNCSNTSSPQRS